MGAGVAEPALQPTVFTSGSRHRGSLAVRPLGSDEVASSCADG